MAEYTVLSVVKTTLAILLRKFVFNVLFFEIAIDVFAIQSSSPSKRARASAARIRADQVSDSSDVIYDDSALAVNDLQSDPVDESEGHSEADNSGRDGDNILDEDTDESALEYPSQEKAKSKDKRSKCVYTFRYRQFRNSLSY